MGRPAVIFFKKIPLFLSVIFHPLLMPSLGVYIMLESGTALTLLSPVAKKIILTTMLTGTLAMPLAFLPFYFFRQLTAAKNPSKKHIAPVMVAAIFYYFVFYLFRNWGVPSPIQSFLIVLIINACLLVVLSKQFSVSFHTYSIGVIIGLIITLIFKYGADSLWFLIISIIVAGSLAFSRLSLNRHTPLQVYGSLILSIVTTFVLLMLL